MYKYLALIFVIALCQTNDQNANFPMIPAKFMQGFSYYDSQTKSNITGKLWYDSSTLSQKFEFKNNTPICTYVYPTSSDCTILVLNTSGYVMLPTRNICCKRDTDIPIQRDVFDFLSYKGNDVIDGVVYDEWGFDGQGIFPSVKYWTNKSQVQVPKRFYLGNGTSFQQMDFWLNSYSQTFNSKNVFAIPANCSNPCPKLNSNDQRSGFGKLFLQTVRSIYKQLTAQQ